MAGAFVEPDFRKGHLEFRYENGIVCIYGTATGLRRLAHFCMSLVEHPNQGHIHVEDYRILTDRSKKAAIAIFDASGEN